MLIEGNQINNFMSSSGQCFGSVFIFYRSGSIRMEANMDPDPIRIQAFPPVNKRSLTVRFHNEAYYVTPCSSVSEKNKHSAKKRSHCCFVTGYLLKKVKKQRKKISWRRYY
jgi:hypothetical protein